MKPVLSADGEEISWLNYKTGLKGVSFKMDVDANRAVIAIVLFHPEESIRQSYYERFVQTKRVLYETLGEEDWVWLLNGLDEYERPVSTISKPLTRVNLFRNEDWPAIISFLKPRIIALDEYWSLVKYGFEELL